MNLSELNNLSEKHRIKELTKCCGSSSWVEAMSDTFPFDSVDEMMEKAEEIWFDLTEEDWLEAFDHHPKIGDVDALREKFASTAKWAEGEQSSVQSANEDVLQRLKKGNDDYEEKFGFIFIVCATGKSAEEMLALLEERLDNEPDEELDIAAGEQNKITKIRLNKLLEA